MEGTHRRGCLPADIPDPLAQLGGGTISESQGENRAGRGAADDQAPESLGDDSGLAGAGSGHNADRPPADGRCGALLGGEPDHSSAVERAIRTRTVRTRLPNCMPLSRSTISSPSSRSWCASAGLEVVTSRVPDLSSISSHRRAGSEPIIERKAAATWVPSSLPPPGCFRSTRGRILPTLSTGLDVTRLDAPDGRAGDQFRRKRTYVDRRDHDLAAAAAMSQQRS